MAGLTKIVFVGNLPYSHSEDLQAKLEETFASVGPVSNFRIAFEKETGKPRGFGFCEYHDTQTAESAIRNLQGIEIGGRALRLDFADVGNHDTRDAGGRPPPQKGRRGGGAGGSLSQNSRDDFNGPSGRNAGGNMAPITGGLPPDLPRGQPLALGQTATDQISKTLAAIPPAQLAEITSQMKQIVSTAPEQARQLLNANPQLTYALFQAMLMMGIVDASILTRMLAPAVIQQQQPQPQPQPQLQQHAAPPPIQPSSVNSIPVGFSGSAYPTAPMRQAVTPSTPYPGTMIVPNYGVLPTAPQPPIVPTPPPVQQPQPQVSVPTAQHAQLIQQVLSLTPQQIDALAPEHRATIMQIRQQALGSLGR